jgi:hypothetical protein
MEADGVSRPWIEACAYIFGPLVYELQVSALAAEGMCVEFFAAGSKNYL